MDILHIGMKKVMRNNVHLRMIIQTTRMIGLHLMAGKKLLRERKQVVVIANGRDLMGNGGAGIEKDGRVAKGEDHIGTIGETLEGILTLTDRGV